MSSTAQPRRLPIVLAVVATAALSAASASVVGRDLGPGPDLFERDFRIERPDGEAVEVTPSRSLLIPYSFGDFDLVADVTLPAGGALDLVLRKVEPKRLGTGDMPLFHGRWVALRIAASGTDGPAFRTREQALFEPEGHNGQVVAPELPSTIVVEARGRTLTANVAGVRHGPFEADDAHGDLAFVVHGGSATVQSLRIDHRPRSVELLPIGWCALIGTLLGVLIAMRARGSGRRGLAAVVAIPAVAWLAGGVVLAHELPMTEPRTTALVCLALSGGPLAIALAGRIHAFGVGLGVLLALGAWEVAVRIEAPRLTPFEDLRLDACFGAASGTAPFDALAQRMHARAAVHTVEAVGERVVFLGGGPLYEGGADFEGWVGALATASAARALDHTLDPVVAPTLFGNAGQQLRMFERFYADAFAPIAIVFAVPPWEGEASERAGAAFLGDAEPIEAPARAPFGWSAVVSLWRRAAEPLLPTTDPSGLRRTLDRLAAVADRTASDVLLIDDPEVPAALREVVGAAANQHGMRRITLSLMDDPIAAIPALSDALVDLLRDR